MNSNSNKVKVAVSGAHSTGKTSFLKEVRKSLQSRGISCSLVSDLAQKCPLPILLEHTIESTLWIVATGIAEEIAALHSSQIVLVDRSVLDAWAYLMAVLPKSQRKKPTPQFLTLQTIIKEWMPTYTLVYMTKIDTAIPIASGRFGDVSYRKRIGSEISRTFRDFNVNSRLLTINNYSEERKWLINHLEIAILK